MKTLGRFVRKWWWVLLIGLGALLVVLWKLLANRPDDPDEPLEVPKLLDKARAEVERVHLEAEIEKARVRTTAEARHEELDLIEAAGNDDPARARADLAEWLTRNL
jgi:hypothetical protein